MGQLTSDTWLGNQLGMDAYKWTMNDDWRENPDAAFEPLAAATGEAFIYTKLPTLDTPLAMQLSKYGFYLADTAVMFEKSRQSDRTLKGVCGVRFAEESDAQGAVRVAQQNFIYDRFHADPNVSDAIANQLKAAWVENYFKGQRGDQMVIALIDSSVVGFNQLLFRGNTLTIDLVATDGGHRRKNIARDMIAYAERELTDFQTVRVSTQVSNIPSVRLYESMGFRLTESQYVFHKYLPA